MTSAPMEGSTPGFQDSNFAALGFKIKTLRIESIVVAESSVVVDIKIKIE